MTLERINRELYLALELFDYMSGMDDESDDGIREELQDKEELRKAVESYEDGLSFDRPNEQLVKACIRHTSYIIFGKTDYSWLPEILKDCCFMDDEIDYYLDKLYE